MCSGCVGQLDCFIDIQCSIEDVGRVDQIQSRHRGLYRGNPLGASQGRERADITDPGHTEGLDILFLEAWKDLKKPGLELLLDFFIGKRKGGIFSRNIFRQICEVISPQVARLNQGAHLDHTSKGQAAIQQIQNIESPQGAVEQDRCALLGNNMWGNTGRSYDAARLLYEKEDVKIDLFVGNRVLVDSNAWDEPDHHDNLMGAYATIKNLPQGLQDIYLIYRDNNPAMLEEYTLGTRIVGDEGPVDWNFEGVYQWGTATDKVVPNRKGEVLDQEAWAAHAELGYTWKTQPLKPRLGVEYNFASGDDDPLDSSNNTFDQLFPTNHVPWGIMDFIGWKNMHSIGSRLSWAQTRNLKITTEWHAFWLDEEQNDAWYDSTGRVFRNAAGKDVSSFLGHEFNLFATYKVSEKLEMEAGYGHYFAGQYAADTAPIGAGSDDADFVYLMTTYKF